MVSCFSTVTLGLMSRMRASAESSFGRPDVLRAVDHLALEVGLVDHVGVDQPERAHARGREVERERRAQARRRR
jgi:hypothetical protein